MALLTKNKKAAHLGCKDLFNRVEEIKPTVHICGHIHEAYGCTETPKTKFINASILNEQYEMANRPIVFEL